MLIATLLGIVLWLALGGFALWLRLRYENRRDGTNVRPDLIPTLVWIVYWPVFYLF